MIPRIHYIVTAITKRHGNYDMISICLPMIHNDCQKSRLVGYDVEYENDDEGQL
jgi:hypothetical protein